MNEYEKLIQGFLDQGYTAKLFDDDATEAGSLLLRHDIDFDVEYAYQISLAEDRMGLQATHFFLNNDSPVCGVEHTYQPKYFEQITYFADSQGRFRYRHPFESEAFEKRAPIQLLTHPIWWVTRSEDPVEKLNEFLEDRVRRFQKHMAQNCTPAARTWTGRNDKKLAVFGCKSTTIFLAESLRSHFEISCVLTISPESGRRNEVADYTDLQPWCEENGLRCRRVERYDLKSEVDRAFFREEAFDLAFVMGWQRLISNDVPWGTIMEVFPSGRFLVRCRGGVLIVHEHEGDARVERGMRLESPADGIRRFERNALGFHDIEGD